MFRCTICKAVVSVAAAFLFGSGALYAQSPVRTYTCETGNVQAHAFSDAATTYTFNEETNLETLWLKADGSTAALNVLPDAVSTPQSFTGNAPVPEFYFGKEKVRFFGLTGAGCLYFGAEDVISAQANPDMDITGSGKLKNLVFLQFLNGTVVSGMSWIYETSVYAGTDAAVRYEIADDTLFVGYENLKVYSQDKLTSLSLSFQYRITPDGSISFVPVAMQPSGVTNKTTGAHYFLFQLGLFPGGSKSEGVFLKDLDGAVESEIQTWGALPKIEITQTSYPTTSYSFVKPAPCQVIASPEVSTWSYRVTDTELELNPATQSSTITWKEGLKCVLLLSTQASLTGDDLPQNGEEYSDKIGEKIGSSVFATVATKETSGSFMKYRSVDGLTPDTRYYLYAFPFNDDCSGFTYNTQDIPRLEIKTAMASPVSLQVNEATISDTGYTLSVSTGDNAPYLLAVSPRQLMPRTLLYNRIPLKEGGYAKGDVITIGDETMEVLAPCLTEESYPVGGLTPGAERWYYVWSTRADQSEFSYEPVCLGVSTLRTMPDTLDFDAAAANANMTSPSAGGPAGWSFGEDNDHSFYVYEREGEGKFLSVAMQQNDEKGVSHSTAVTPVFVSGDARKAGATFNLYFWKLSTVGEYEPATLDRTDTLYLQYRLEGQDSWTTASTVTSAASVNGGNLSVEMPAFETAGKSFRLRVLAASNFVPSGRESAPSASIRSIRVYVPCSEVSAPQVSEVMHNRALLSWTDVNTPRAGSYAVMWKQSDASAWQEMNVLVREASLTKLTPDMPYVASIRSVCGAGDTSIAQEVYFQTHRTLPYALKPTAEGAMPSEITFRTGGLPASGDAALQEVGADAEVWKMEKFEGDSMFISLKRAEEVENTLWLRFPVLAVGNTRGKAQLDMTLWGTNGLIAWDSLFVLVSSDSLFSRTEVVATFDSSYFVSEAKKVSVEFEVNTPYLYIALYTKFEADGGNHTLFANHISVDWSDIYCDPAGSIRQSHLEKNSIDISWSGEGLEYGLFYREADNAEVGWDTIFTSETSWHLDNLKSNTSYEYYLVTYCDDSREKFSEASDIRVFTTLMSCEISYFEVVAGSETSDGVTVIVLTDAPTKQASVRPADEDACPYDFGVMDLKFDTVKLRGFTQCENTTYYIKVRAVCPTETGSWTEEQTFTTLPYSSNSPFEEAGLNGALRVRVTADEIVLENLTGEYVRELQAFSTAGRLLNVFAVNSSADVRLAHRLPQGAVLLRAVGENGRTATFKAIVM